MSVKGRDAGTDAAGRDPRRAHHARLHRRQRLSRPEGRPHLRVLDPGRRDLDGGAVGVQELHDPREQHRADGRVGGRHAVGDHLRAAGPCDRRLVDRFSVLDVVPDLRLGRHARRAVHDPAAPRDGDELRPSLSRRRRRRRSARSRRSARAAQAGAESREGLLAVVWGAVASAGLAILAATRIATAEFTQLLLASARKRRERLRHGLFAGADRRGLPRRPVGRHGDAARPSHRLGRRRADLDRRCIPQPPARRSPTTPITSGARRCASSAPARSPSRRSGRCSS